MVIAENKNGSIAPMNSPTITSGSSKLIWFNFAETANDANNASAVRAADQMANPLPIAAVVLPTESRVSVISLTLSGSSDISAIPPALSETGP